MPKKKTPTQKPATVDAYFAALPRQARSALSKIRTAIRSVVPEESVEVLSYRIPAFKHRKVLVWYAAFTDHCSLFPTSAVVAAFKDELKDFAVSKGTIHFPLDQPLPIALIRRIVKARLENANKKPL